MNRSFDKLSGAGNDFILVEGRADPALARRLCHPRRGFGADGLLALKRRGAMAELSYFNADGSRAFCGNGLRCAAWWIFRRGWTKGRRNFALKTSRGILRAQVSAGGAAVEMPAPKAVRLNRKIKVLGRALTIHSLDTGVPHAVLFWKKLDAAPVAAVGRALRRHKAFAPRGTNVDFIELEKGALHLRTYERGVEAETLACGTGAVAAALAAFLLGKAKPPVRLRARGGDRLSVRFRGNLTDVWLEGPVVNVLSGTFVQ